MNGNTNIIIVPFMKVLRRVLRVISRLTLNPDKGNKLIRVRDSHGPDQGIIRKGVNIKRGGKLVKNRNNNGLQLPTQRNKWSIH